MIILNLLNRIFGDRGSLSREEISSYQKDGKYKHSIEEKSLTDDFDSDALDGWTESNTPVEEMNSLDKRFNEKYKSNGWNFSTILFFALFFMTSSIILIFTYTSNKTKKQRIAELNKQEVINIESIEDTDPRILTEEDKSINKLNQVSKEKEIQPNSLKRENPLKTEKEVDTVLSNPKKITIPDISPEITENIPTVKSNSTLKYSFVDEFYLHDFKLIDYRKFRDTPIKNRKLVPVGTPADQEYYINQSEDDFVWKEIDIPYVEYLDETIAYFEQSSYKKALKRFNKILDTYEDDINAHFYGGLCYYNLGQYEKAIAHFEKSYNIEFGNFRQEAQWFKAKAFVEKGMLKDAKSELNKIIDESNFYADQAKKLIKQL